ncbi:battenin isoform X1 [Lethenteron reissneri]|uniref:battenin isoform X1 n=1 Tax=Lethenteron reissneri TaxID=7753 RepID=UPI002AB6D45C|nr:battenin isoform X1 [Lethenteron reissneri]
MDTIQPHRLDADGTETLPAVSDAANGTDRTETLPGVSDAENVAERKRDWRNFAGFWILGLTNNFAYVVMLSAAHDILKQQEAGNSTHPNNSSSSSSFMHDTSPATHTESWEPISSNRFDCNPHSTAVILLADILPTLLIKSTAPLFIHRIAYRFRVVICVLTAAASFLIVALSKGVIMSIIGVTFASISSGLGELTFLSLTAHFKSSVLRFWSSGTGAAGLAGSLSYLGFTQAGLSPSSTLFIMLFVPPLMAASYWLLLVFPPGWSQRECGNTCSLRPAEESQRPLLGTDSDDLAPDPNNEHYGLENDILSFKDKWLIVKSLLRFTVPLALVYFAEYFINQGLFELLYFPNYYLSHGDQYRWYQATYQLGVFVSRSSAQWIRISRTWILALLQVINLIAFFFLVFFTLLPTFWLALPIILWEGLLGGAAYVNTFLNISAERDKRRREFSLGVASVADTLGIALSGATAIPLHDYLCAL